jgi:putative salt-induced outer membrane protein YdiY
MKQALALLAYAFVVSFSTLSSAQDRPGGLLKRESVSTGKTEVASEGFEARGAASESKDATELALNAGAFLAAGNSRSVAATFAEQLRLRRAAHQLSVASGVNYGRSAPDAASGLETTVENYQAKIRYDYFLSGSFALFLGVSARKDRFQGLSLRLNFAPGAAYYFIDEKEHQFWGELGYNLSHDIRTDQVLRTASAEGKPLEEHETRHYGRAFVGYSNKLNEFVTFTTSLEYLLGIAPLEDDRTGRTNWRLGWIAGWSAKVSDKFSVATSVTVDYDNNPLPDVHRTDATTAINLVYALL